MTKQVVNQQIGNLSVACSKTMSTSNGMYRVYTVVEASKEDVFKTLEKNVSSQKELETLFNRERFRKDFDEEMAKCE
ncbi:MAG: hypothetical protein LBF67_02600 [Prevotellaceae bacterium]|jgi:uncharacterized protein (UPF0333 family)|nr:hypothetical protein [Prevotellaceae bacterium]